jgi:uncharacterized membrane-anchored protein
MYLEVHLMSKLCPFYWFSPFFLLLFCASASAQPPDNTKPAKKIQVNWQQGPLTAQLGSEAKIEIPKGYLFADPAEAKKFLELTHNLPSGNELGILRPVGGRWFVIFEFNDAGYIKDDEKKSLDADAILESLKKNTEAGNEVRKQNGWSTLRVTDWVVKPHYDEETHNLEWSIECVDEKGSASVNLSTRYLGRKGYMSVELVGFPNEVSTVLPVFRRVLGGFAYNPESDYRAFRSGDKVAKYGLSALVLGGTAGVLAKTGMLKAIWKFILVGWKLILAGFAALGGFIKKLFSGRKSQSAQTQDGV